MPSLNTIPSETNKTRAYPSGHVVKQQLLQDTLLVKY